MNNISSATIIRTIILVLAVFNSVLTMAGKNPLPFSEDELYLGLTNAFTIGATFWGWWRNNSITPEAIKADKYLNELREDN